MHDALQLSRWLTAWRRTTTSRRVQRRQPVAWLIDERLATSASAERENKSKRTLLQSERPQLNTIRHVVIWLDPWSRERDLLAAVVDR